MLGCRYWELSQTTIINKIDQSAITYNDHFKTVLKSNNDLSVIGISAFRGKDKDKAASLLKEQATILPDTGRPSFDAA